MIFPSTTVKVEDSTAGFAIRARWRPTLALPATTATLKATEAEKAVEVTMISLPNGK
jgi:hypothetical protein